MAKNKIYADIVVDNEQLEQAITHLNELLTTVQKINAGGGKINLAKEIKAVIAAIEELAKTEKKVASENSAFNIKKLEFSKLELQRHKELLKQAAEKDKIRKKEIDAAQKANQALLEETAIMSKQAVTYNELSKQMGIMIKQRKDIDISTKEGAKSFNDLTKKIAEHNTALKGMDESAGNFQRNVGDYKNKIREAIPALGGFTDALWGIVKNPVGAIITAIAAALAILGAAFKQTQMGGDLFQKGMAYLKGTMDVLQGTFNDVIKGATTMKELFSSPIETIKKMGKEVDKLADSYYNLAKAQTNIQFKQAALLTVTEKLRGEEAQLRAIVDDANSSFAEREKAVKKLSETTEKLAAINKQSAQDNTNIAQAEYNMILAKGGAVEGVLPAYQKLQEATAAQIQADNEYKATLIENRQKIKDMQRDEWEQNVDMLSDLSERQMAHNEARINNEKLSVSARRGILAEMEGYYTKHLGTLNALFTKVSGNGSKIDLAQILGIEDETARYAFIKTLGLSEIAVNQLRDKLMILSDTRVMLSDASVKLDESDATSAQKKYDKALKIFDLELDLEKLKFESKKRTPEEMAVFELGAEIAKNEEILRLKSEYGIALTDIELKLLEQKIANDKAELASATTTTEGKKMLKRAEIEAAYQLVDAVSDAAGRESHIAKGLAIAKQAMAAKQTLMAILQGTAETAKVGFPTNIPLLLTFAAQTVGLVSSIRKIKFADGGILPSGGGVAQGPSHAQGGIQIPHLGSIIEGGEYIIKKSATERFKPLLDSINSFDKSGPTSSKYFANGGILPFQDRQAAAATQPATVVQQVPVLVLDDMLDAANARARAVRVQGV